MGEVVRRPTFTRRMAFSLMFRTTSAACESLSPALWSGLQTLTQVDCVIRNPIDLLLP